MIQVIDLPRPGRRPMLESVVFRGIVFNMSWEDPEMDRRALNIAPTDTVLSITSAGCNPLNILTQSPQRLLCVDGNRAQNALMEIKVYAIANLAYEEFFDVFAARRPWRIKVIYADRLRPYLSGRTRDFWDRNLRILAKGLYRGGRMGVFCRILRAYLTVIGVRQRTLESLFECATVEEQRAIYERHVAPRLWRFSSRLFVSARPLMYLAGVHPQQCRLVDKTNDFFELLRERIDHVLRNVPIRENYFLSQAATGRFRGDCVPPYLREENYETLRHNLSRVTIANGWLQQFVDTLAPGSVNKFNLLDIFDWMNEQTITATLNSILRAAAPDARLIYRSGSRSFDTPTSVAPRLRVQKELSRDLLLIDRTATYGSFYVCDVERNGQRAAATAS